MKFFQSIWRLAQTRRKTSVPLHVDTLDSDSAFDHLVAMARAINEIDPNGLHSFVAAILRPLQSEQMLSAAERPQHSAPESIDAERLFMGMACANLFSFSQLAVRNPHEFEVDLARDLTLPTMWHRQSIASAFGAIGSGLKCGAWRQDANHQVSLWLPWRIAFVSNGNHSIAAGILRAEGAVKPTSVYDLKPLLCAIRCDGKQYRQVSDGSVIADVEDQRIAAVWEIGRLMERLDMSS